MAKVVPLAEFDRIVDEISAHADGIGIDALSQRLGHTISRRTLQRRMARLIAVKRIVSEGEGRALRYYASLRVVASFAHGEASGYGQVIAEPYVPTSSEGNEINAYVRQPIQLRRPVGYDRSFLEAYRPNETGYLPAEIREHLHNIGRSPDGERPAGTYARDMLGRLLIDLAWASSRLEGNTYTRLDTQNLIELGQAAEGKDRREAQMILNHKAAIELLVEQAEDIGFNTFTFFNLHALLSENLLADHGEGGRLRNRVVEISGTVYHPLGVPQQVEGYFRMILQKADAIADPFEQAFFVMVHIPYLQPFVDVNKRVSRLAANIPLIRHNLCPLSFVDVPERAYVDGNLGIYELARVDLLRDVFIWAYERSCQRYTAIRETIAEPDPVRQRYREALISLVRDFVLSAQVPSKPAIRESATMALIPPQDIDQVVKFAFDDLSNLHEGNVARYRLRLSEYRAWQSLQRATRT